MKLLLFCMTMILLLSSCHRNGNPRIICSVNNESVYIRNAGTTLSVDNDCHFGLIFRKNDEDIQLNGDLKKGPSVSLIDSSGTEVPFRVKTASVNDLNDKSGDGKNICITAESADKKILCNIFISACSEYPDAILINASFKNVSSEKYYCRGYILNKVTVNLSGNNQKWMTFQGASYNWGQDFVFQLPDTFNRDNYMGLNALKAGGGIPVTDIWNKDFGIALACLGNKPEPVSLPVNAENGAISLGIEELFSEKVILPEESLKTVQTAIIIHEGDFYEPLKKFSGLMRDLLSDFQISPEYTYQPEWCTWGYNQNFTAEQILDKIDTLKALGIKSVILDDGWSVKHGDWIPDPRKFPAGDEDFIKLIERLHQNGLKVWLWWVPGYTDSTSSLADSHPEWLILNKDGTVHRSYGLCPAYEPVQDHFKQLVRKFTEKYRLDGFKLDFGEINSAPPCYNPLHHHSDPYESYYGTPELFRNICNSAKQSNPQIVLEYCSCGLPPNIYHLPFVNLAVTSDPSIGQITNRIKMYKALMGDDFPVLEEYCGVLAGPLYQLTIGSGGVPGTFSTLLDDYHEKWLKIYHKYQLSKGHYLNLYDIGFDYPETHVIKKDSSFFYAFYTHPWKKMGPERFYRFDNEFDSYQGKKKEVIFPEESWSGKVELRGLDINRSYKIVDYENDREIGSVTGKDPFLDISFINYLLVEVTPVK